MAPTVCFVGASVGNPEIGNSRGATALSSEASLAARWWGSASTRRPPESAARWLCDVCLAVSEKGEHRGAKALSLVSPSSQGFSLMKGF